MALSSRDVPQRALWFTGLLIWSAFVLVALTGVPVRFSLSLLEWGILVVEVNSLELSSPEVPSNKSGDLKDEEFLIARAESAAVDESFHK